MAQIDTKSAIIIVTAPGAANNPANQALAPQIAFNMK